MRPRRSTTIRPAPFWRAALALLIGGAMLAAATGTAGAQTVTGTTAAVYRLDSGLVGATVPFPELDLTVSINKQICFDTVFRVTASPVPPDQIRPYKLTADSTFQRGCFGACLCVVGPKLPIAGTFALVPLA